MPKVKLTWHAYPVGSLFKVTVHKYVLRVAKSISDLEPSAEKVFKDRKLTITGYYNKRGYCVGYALDFKDRPAIVDNSFYLLLDYVANDEKPKEMTFPTLGGKADSSIRLVKFGVRLKHRMYIFIYRRKQNG